MNYFPQIILLVVYCIQLVCGLDVHVAKPTSHVSDQNCEISSDLYEKRLASAKAITLELVVKNFFTYRKPTKKHVQKQKDLVNKLYAHRMGKEDPFIQIYVDAIGLFENWSAIYYALMTTWFNPTFDIVYAELTDMLFTDENKNIVQFNIKPIFTTKTGNLSLDIDTFYVFERCEEVPRLLWYSFDELNPYYLNQTQIQNSKILLDLAIDTCTMNDVICKDIVDGFQTIEECVEKMLELKLCDGESTRGDTFGCHGVHLQTAPFDPHTHCKHFLPGHDVCSRCDKYIDSPYEKYKSILNVEPCKDDVYDLLLDLKLTCGSILDVSSCEDNLYDSLEKFNSHSNNITIPPFVYLLPSNATVEKTICRKTCNRCDVVQTPIKESSSEKVYITLSVVYIFILKMFN